MNGRLAAERGALVHLHLDAVALLDRAPERVGLGEEHVRVEGEDPCLRLDLQQQVEQDAVLLLERARQGETRVEALCDVREKLSCREALGLSSRHECVDLGVHDVGTHDETLSIR